MPILIKNIQGEVITNVIDNVRYVSSVYGEIQQEDYIKLNGFIGYTQDLSRAEETYGIVKPLNFGLLDGYNKKIVTLEINY